MRFTLRCLLPLSLLLLLSCKSYEPLPAGALLMEMPPLASPMRWNEVKAKLGPHARQFTVDGEEHERLIVVSNIGDGDSLFKADNEALAIPTYRSGMQLFELPAFINDSLNYLYQGLLDIQSQDLRPVPVGEGVGVRYYLKYQTPQGVVMRGDVMTFVIDGRLRVLIFTAADVQYYPKYEDVIDGLFESLGN